MMNNEKAYQTMKSAGAGDLALGVIILVTGIACGILAIINGAKLMRNKSDLIF